MGDGLNIALELLVLGLIVVFSVLVFLMFIMGIMSKIVNLRLTSKTKPTGEPEVAVEEDLAVIAAIINELNPGQEFANIQLKLIQ